jgi:hypothetical protein
VIRGTREGFSGADIIVKILSFFADRTWRIGVAWIDENE